MSRPDPKEPVVGEGEMGGPTIELPAVYQQEYSSLTYTVSHIHKVYNETILYNGYTYTGTYVDIDIDAGECLHQSTQ